MCACTNAFMHMRSCICDMHAVVRPCVCVQICMYACMHACMHVCMYGWMDGLKSIGCCEGTLPQRILGFGRTRLGRLQHGDLLEKWMMGDLFDKQGWGGLLYPNNNSPPPPLLKGPTGSKGNQAPTNQPHEAPAQTPAAQRGLRMPRRQHPPVLARFVWLVPAGKEGMTPTNHPLWFPLKESLGSFSTPWVIPYLSHQQVALVCWNFARSPVC